MDSKKQLDFQGGLTAAKVAKLVTNLRKNWDELDQQELSQKIIDLHDKVSMLKGGKRVVFLQKETEHLHFDFVFPASLELKSSPYSFAKTIETIAKEILKTNSLDAFQELNAVQQQEILRRCA